VWLDRRIGGNFRGEVRGARRISVLIREPADQHRTAASASQFMIMTITPLFRLAIPMQSGANSISLREFGQFPETEQRTA
jgi:hypothetical protein